MAHRTQRSKVVKRNGNESQHEMEKILAESVGVILIHYIKPSLCVWDYGILKGNQWFN